MTFSRDVVQPNDGVSMICTTCRTQKVLSEFYRAKPGSMNDGTYCGYAMPCKECNRARCRGKKRSAKQKARDAERGRRPEVLARNAARNLARYNAMTAEQKAAHIAKTNANYYANVDERRAKNRAAYHTPEGKAKSIHYQRAKRATPEGRAAHNAASRIRSKKPHVRLLAAVNSHKRRTRIRANVDDLTPAQWLKVKAAHGDVCVYCGKSPERFEMDHVVPISAGGDHSMHNIVPACRPCNRKKHAKSVDEFLVYAKLPRHDFLMRRVFGLFCLIRD